MHKLFYAEERRINVLPCLYDIINDLKSLNTYKIKIYTSKQFCYHMKDKA